VRSTIFIVEDEPDVLESLREAFEYEGYDVVTAADGAVALQKLREAPASPRAAILDVLMPGLDGGALYAAMQGDPGLAGVSVIFCTSAPSRAPAGPLILKKPVDLNRLLSAVNALCRP
jgi:DNA-binding response OmpR family regulator